MTAEHKILTLIDRGITDRDLLIRLAGHTSAAKLRTITPRFVQPTTLWLTSAGVDRLNELDRIHKI